MGPGAAAWEDEAAVAEPDVDVLVEPPVDVADVPEEAEALAPSALAFNLPQTKEWQKA
jgi:hypothetical protein